MEGLAWTVLMRVSGTPQRPKPPARRVELERMFSRAAEAEGRILLIEWWWEVVEKARVERRESWGVCVSLLVKLAVGCGAHFGLT